MKRSLLVSVLVIGGCAHERSKPPVYPDSCGSHVECFTKAELDLTRATRILEEARMEAMRTVPVGTVAAFAGNVEPFGWMFCDGRKLDKNDKQYSPLFDAIGTSHGGDASPYFQIPDYRGVFLRGLNDQSGRDPEASQRRSMGEHGTGNAGDAIGSFQDDALQTHGHSVTNTFKATGTNNTRDVSNGGDHYNSDPRYAQSVVTVNEPTGARVAGETRPKNVAVRWMIKFR
jgi:microcystin-dependent protein